MREAQHIGQPLELVVNQGAPLTVTSAQVVDMLQARGWHLNPAALVHVHALTGTGMLTKGPRTMPTLSRLTLSKATPIWLTPGKCFTFSSIRESARVSLTPILERPAESFLGPSNRPDWLPAPAYVFQSACFPG